MKTSISLILTVLLFLFFQKNLFSQVEPSLKNLRQLAESEKRLKDVDPQKPHFAYIVNNYDLKYHRFELAVDPAQDYIRGAITSYFMSTEQMTSIEFELTDGMVADSALHNGFMVYLINHSNNVINVPFGEIVPSGTLDSVKVFYHGSPASTGFGSYGMELHNGAAAMWTLSEPYGASDWWPSKNDLNDKIDSVDLFVLVPKGNHVASNGLLMKEVPWGANYTLAIWKHRYPIASYLIAIAATNYSRYSDYYVANGDTLQVHNFVYPEDSAGMISITPGVLPSIGLFEELFEPYPYRKEKYGQAQFGWGGGMEHQTMTFLGRSAFNHEIIAHELAHQWFGDKITCGSWQDIWLNEGFATYCAGLTYEHFFDGYYWPIWKYNNISYVCTQPGGSVFCTDTSSVGRIFDSRLSYSKGALVLHMLRWVVGDEAFFTGMRNYLADPDLSYGFALTNDFKSHMEAASGKNLTEFFNDWLYGEGYPSYFIQVGQSGDNTVGLIIEQDQSHESVSFFEMPVPVRFYGNGTDTTIVFNNTMSGEAFWCNPGFKVDSAKFDPDMWIVSWQNFVSLSKDDDIPAGSVLSLVPNPASDLLKIKHNLGLLRSAEVFSLGGQKAVATIQQNESGLCTLNTSKLASGFYLLRMKFDNLVVLRKFIVER